MVTTRRCRVLNGSDLQRINQAVDRLKTLLIGLFGQMRIERGSGWAAMAQQRLKMAQA